MSVATGKETQSAGQRGASRLWAIDILIGRDKSGHFGKNVLMRRLTKGRQRGSLGVPEDPSEESRLNRPA